MPQRCTCVPFSFRCQVEYQLILNGKLYTSSAGAQIISSEESGSILFNTAAPTSNGEVLQSTAWQGIADATKRESITMVPALLTNGEGVEPATYDTKGMAAGTKVHYCEDCDKWVKQIKVTFDDNIEGTESVATQIVVNPCCETLNPNAFPAPEGMKFAGWSTAADGVGTEENPAVAFADGDPITATEEGKPSITADITLYAQWEKDGLKGDVDLDGIVGPTDLTTLARHVAEIEFVTDATALENAEVTGDDVIGPDDLTKLARYVAEIIDSLD